MVMPMVEKPLESPRCLNFHCKLFGKCWLDSWLTAFYEVRLPTGFDFLQLNSKRSLDAWKALGLVSASGEYFGGVHEAQLWLPAGQYGPALLLTKNFEVIRVYNNSSSYALGVSLLAKKLPVAMILFNLGHVMNSHYHAPKSSIYKKLNCTRL